MTAVQPEPLGTHSLWLPPDWFDLLSDDDAADAWERFAELAQRMAPDAGPAVWDRLTEGLVVWREQMLADGALVHGVVSAPTEDGGRAEWQVLAGVVAVPDLTGAGVDAGALLYEGLSRQLPQDVPLYIEEFPTEMGHGVGIVTYPVVRRQDLQVPEGTPLDPTVDAVQFGVSLAVTAPPEGRQGLLVVGICADPQQVPELTAIVANMAARSTVTPAE